MPTEPTHLTAEELEIREIVNRVSRAKQVLHDDDPVLTLRAAVKLVDSLEAARRELAGARMEVAVLMAVEPPVDEVRRELAEAKSDERKRVCDGVREYLGMTHTQREYSWHDVEDALESTLPAPPAQQEGQCNVCDRPKSDCGCIENGGNY